MGTSLGIKAQNSWKRSVSGLFYGWARLWSFSQLVPGKPGGCLVEYFCSTQVIIHIVLQIEYAIWEDYTCFFYFWHLYPSAHCISLQTLMSVRYFLAFVQMDAALIAKDLFIVSAPKALHWMELAVCVWVRFMSLCILCMKSKMDFSYFLGIEHFKIIGL